MVLNLCIEQRHISGLDKFLRKNVRPPFEPHKFNKLPSSKQTEMLAAQLLKNPKLQEELTLRGIDTWYEDNKAYYSIVWKPELENRLGVPSELFITVNGADGVINTLSELKELSQTKDIDMSNVNVLDMASGACGMPFVLKVLETNVDYYGGLNICRSQNNDARANLREGGFQNYKIVDGNYLNPTDIQTVSQGVIPDKPLIIYNSDGVLYAGKDVPSFYNNLKATIDRHVKSGQPVIWVSRNICCVDNETLPKAIGDRLNMSVVPTVDMHRDGINNLHPDINVTQSDYSFQRISEHYAFVKRNLEALEPDQIQQIFGSGAEGQEAYQKQLQGCQDWVDAANSEQLGHLISVAVIKPSNQLVVA